MKELLNAMPTKHQPERKQEIDTMRSASEYINFLKHRLSNAYDMIRVMSVKGRVSDGYGTRDGQWSRLWMLCETGLSGELGLQGDESE
jgi:hypothetical protein